MVRVIYEPSDGQVSFFYNSGRPHDGITNRFSQCFCSGVTACSPSIDLAAFIDLWLCYSHPTVVVNLNLKKSHSKFTWVSTFGFTSTFLLCVATTSLLCYIAYIALVWWFGWHNNLWKWRFLNKIPISLVVQKFYFGSLSSTKFTMFSIRRCISFSVSSEFT